MHSGVYKIAGKVIEINSLYSAVQNMCNDYLCDENPDFSVTVTKANIDFEKTRPGDDGVVYGDEYYETLAVYRMICERLIDCGILLVHGSSLSLDDTGYLFCAKSGTGKSTHTALWRKQFGKRVTMINDDKPLLKIDDGGVTVFGTPWCGKENIGNNVSASLKNICFLERGENNTVERLSKQEGYKKLLKHTNILSGRENTAKVLSLLDKACNMVDFYDMKCNTDISAAVTAFENMR